MAISLPSALDVETCAPRVMISARCLGELSSSCRSCPAAVAPRNRSPSHSRQFDEAQQFVAANIGMPWPGSNTTNARLAEFARVLQHAVAPSGETMPRLTFSRRRHVLSEKLIAPDGRR